LLVLNEIGPYLELGPKLGLKSFPIGLT